MANVKPVPDGYHVVTPYLIVKGAAAAIDYYKKIFGATELFRMEHEGRIGHAEIKIGDSPVMLSDEHPELGFVGPKTIGGTPVGLMVYVEDVDSVFKNAIQDGATEVKPLEDQFYGDRSGTITDPFGHVWTIATHKEDLTEEQMKERAAAAASG